MTLVTFARAASRTAALRRPCPKCGARAGAPCRAMRWAGGRGAPLRDGAVHRPRVLAPIAHQNNLTG